MTEKPILFNTGMVKAILGGLKTQTRRVCKALSKHGTIAPEWIGYKPPYHAGDILWVRETWNGIKLGQRGKEETSYWYRADEDDEHLNPDDKWRPSIHMPREAARLFLRVTSVRVERLQQIDADGLRAEGLTSMAVQAGDVEIGRMEFKRLWNSTLKAADIPSYGWDANPWVWVIGFERVEEVIQ